MYGNYFQFKYRYLCDKILHERLIIYHFHITGNFGKKYNHLSCMSHKETHSMYMYLRDCPIWKAMQDPHVVQLCFCVI